MITYLIHTTSIWAVLYMTYKMLLSKEKYFFLNRFYLLCSLVLGLLLPLIQFVSFSTEQLIPEVSALYYQQVNYISQLSTSSDTSSNTSSTVINWTSVLFGLISFGMATMLVRNIIAGLKIKTLYKESDKVRHPEFTEVRTKKDHLPFSFFRYIFFSTFKLKEEDRLSILSHEIHHVRAKHTWDILFVESIKVIFWWNPLVHLYKRAITENHEYAADHAAIQQGSRKEYCSLLLQTNMPGVNLDLGHPFFQTYIKKRIEMMYRKNSTWRSYLKFVLPVMAIVLMAFVIKEDKLELDYRLNSDYIDLFADETLLIPGKDYIIDRERGKVRVLNATSTSTKGTKYCMFIIEEPRPLSEFKDEQKPLLNNFVSVKLDADGRKTMGAKEMETKVIFDLVKELKNKCGEEVHVKLAVDDKVENRHVVQFLDEAFNSQTQVELEYEEGNVRYDIPSISPLAPKDVIKETGFGMRMHPVHKKMKMHKGLDLVAKMGTPVFATADGVVTKVQSNTKGYGRHVVVDHGNGYVTLYAHLKEYVVSNNDEVKQGQQIGLVGNSGMSSSPHLHYEVKLDNKAVDPINYGALQLEKPRFHRELEREAHELFEAKKVDKDKLIEGSKNLFGVEDLNFDLVDDSFNLGANFKDQIRVRVGSEILREGSDYQLDRKSGMLTIINEDYINNEDPIQVVFLSGEPHNLERNGDGKSEKNNDLSGREIDSKFRSSPQGNDSLRNKFMLMPFLEECKSFNIEDAHNCSMNAIIEFANSIKKYPEEALKEGYEGRMVYELIIDKGGNIIDYKDLQRDNRPDFNDEGKRVFEAIQKEFKFVPNVNQNTDQEFSMHLIYRYELDEELLKHVIRKGANDVDENTSRIRPMYITDQGLLSFGYSSEMNVPSDIIVRDPEGKVIYEERFDYMYKKLGGSFFVPNKINGTYKIEVTQDGMKVISELECDVFD